jgi:ElaB/YqjD/DUF883 family membrane-anchored ribosome-binding protein
MPENTPIGAVPGGPVSAGPEQHLHVDHDSAVRHGSASPPPQGGVAGLKDRAAGLYQDSRERVSDGVEGARQWAGDRYDAAREQVADTVERTRGTLSDAADRGSAHLRRQRSRLEVFVAENPALVGVVGIAAGLIVGALLPRTAQEDRTVGPYADEARDQGLRLAREAMHSGRAYVEAALDQADEALGRAEGEVRADLGARDAASGLRNGPSGRYQNH